MRLQTVDDGDDFEPANAEAIPKGEGLHLGRSMRGKNYIFNQTKKDRPARRKVAPAPRTYAWEEDTSPNESARQVARKKTDPSASLRASAQADHSKRAGGSNSAMADGLTAQSSAANFVDESLITLQLCDLENEETMATHSNILASLPSTSSARCTEPQMGSDQGGSENGDTGAGRLDEEKEISYSIGRVRFIWHGFKWRKSQRVKLRPMDLDSQPLGSINSSQPASSAPQPVTSTGKDDSRNKRSLNDTKKKSSSKARGRQSRQDGRFAGSIQEVDEANCNVFDRDLYMRINNLAVCDDPCQCVCYDPFLNADDIPESRVSATDDTGVNLQDSKPSEDETKKPPKTSLFSRFFLWFKPK